MRFDPKRLRTWFATAAVFILLVVAGFYFYARWRVHHAVQRAAQKLHVDIQQSTEGFTLSKSEGGRTLFSIHAKRAEQFKQAGRAVLHEVNIIIYGDTSNRFDQIYGSEFAYDPASGDVTAAGFEPPLANTVRRYFAAIAGFMMLPWSWKTLNISFAITSDHM